MQAILPSFGELFPASLTMVPPLTDSFLVLSEVSQCFFPPGILTHSSPVLQILEYEGQDANLITILALQMKKMRPGKEGELPKLVELL